MKNLLILFAISHLFHVKVTAQIELVGSCDEITEIHKLSGLDGYEVQMEPGNGVPLDMAFCNDSGDIDNPHWLAFTVDPYFEYSLDLLFSNCVPGPLTSSVGGQIGVYDTCDFTAAPLFCYSQQSDEESLISISDYIDFESGKTYYMLLDGYAGSVCNIYMDVEKYLPMESITDWYHVASGFGGSSNYWYSDIGDTIFNNLEYRIIQPSNTPDFPRYIREDKVNKKVYTYNAFNDLEELLYDFSAGIGDIVNYNTGSYEVTNIDVVESLYGELKRWELDGPGPPIYVIEGIGSEELFLANTVSDPVYSLLCAYHESNKIYGSDNCLPPPRWFTSFTQIEASICEGDSYELNGNTYTEEGEYVDTLINTAGGDSIVTLNLNVLSPGYYNIIATYCEGDILFTNGIIFDVDSPSGNIILTGAAANGCDSIVNVELTFLPELEYFYQSTICEGSFELWAGDTITQAGDYTFNLETVNGCDSTINLSVEILNDIETLVTHFFCEGDNYIVDNVEYTESSMFQIEYEAVNGCDSVVSYDLKVFPSFFALDTIYFCPGDSVIVDGVAMFETGIHQIEYEASNGCDSIVAIHLIELLASDSECLTATSNLSYFDFEASPNPFNQTIYVTSEEAVQSIELISISGVKADFIGQIGKQEFIYDARHLISGIYLMKVNSKANVAIKRIVKY